MSDIVTLNKESLSIWQANDLEPMRYDYDIKPGDIVLDIGSYQREWGKVFEEKGCNVEYFDALDNRAAWKCDGELMMAGAYYYTSMYGKQNASYKCVDIAPYLQKEIALVKINIEGGEYELIEYIISKGLHENIINLQVQFHLIDGKDCEAMYKVISDLLKETHKLIWRYPFCWESWQRKDEYYKKFANA
jgi:hypothetical protein